MVGVAHWKAYTRETLHLSDARQNTYCAGSCHRVICNVRYSRWNCHHLNTTTLHFSPSCLPYAPTGAASPPIKTLQISMDFHFNHFAHWLAVSGASPPSKIEKFWQMLRGDVIVSSWAFNLFLLLSSPRLRLRISIPFTDFTAHYARHFL